MAISVNPGPPDIWIDGTPVSKAQVRALLAGIISDANTTFDQTDANIGKIFSARQTAVAAGQSALPDSYGRIVTIEGTVLVFRGPGQTTPDPLFGTYPNWGELFRIDHAGLSVNIGKIYSSRQEAVDTGQVKIPDTYGRIATVEDMALALRGPGAAEDQLFAEYPNWGIVRKYPDISAIAKTVENAATVILENFGGNVDVYTANAPAGYDDAGANPADIRRISFQVIVANSGEIDPTLQIAGSGALPILRADGSSLSFGDLVPGRWYEALRHSAQWKLLTATGSPNFTSNNKNDPVPVSVVSGVDGESVLGFRPDGSLYAPTAFGAFHWPGDDIVLFRTPAGDPIVAISTPTGKLIANMEA